MCVPGSALGARGVEILGSILAFQSNGLFIGHTNRARERGGVHCLWPVVVSIEECTSGCCDKDGVEGLQPQRVATHTQFVLVAVIRLYGYRHAHFWESC